MRQVAFTQLTNIGKREINQDSILAKHSIIAKKHYAVFCVADGVGGLADGSQASDLAVKAIEDWWEAYLPVLSGEEPPADSAICYELIKLFTTTNADIVENAVEQNTRKGTTCSLLLICGKQCFVAHVGDSRIYLAERGYFSRSQFSLVTEDHTHRVDLLRQGVPIDEIDANPQKNHLTSCLGVMEHPRIFTSAKRLKGRNTFVLCSDGVYNTMTDTEIETIVAEYKQHEHIANKLLVLALERETQDNASVVVVSC